MGNEKFKLAIQQYVIDGDIAGVLRELDGGTDVDVRASINEPTPLMAALESGEATLEMVGLLIFRGADVNASVVDSGWPMLMPGTTVLMLAAKSGDIDIIRAVLDAGADVRVTTPNGYDALILAACSLSSGGDSRLLPVFQLLISRGANVNTGSDYCESALTIACRAGRFDAINLLFEAGANLEQLDWTPLMFAIALGKLSDVQTQLDAGADLKARDFNYRTPWLLSTLSGEIAKAKLLLSTGASRMDRGWCGVPPVMLAARKNDAAMLRWLLDEGFNPDATDDFKSTPLIEAAECGSADCVKELLDAGVEIHAINSSHDSAIKVAMKLDIVRLLVNHGADLNDINDETRAALTSLPNDGKFHVSREDYLAASTRRFGTANPEKMNLPFWRNMITSGCDAYSAQNHFGWHETEPGPVWCFKRFGKSINELPDGRIIEIAGEHEDYYDPDFCIYNDVIVHHGDGTFDIYGYPQEVFPPTDFHSATLVGSSIYIIGSIGYQALRNFEDTPVYRLNIDDLRIEKVETTGDKPGWISRHHAIHDGISEIRISGGQLGVSSDGKEDYVDNTSVYALNLATRQWRKM